VVQNIQNTEDDEDVFEVNGDFKLSPFLHGLKRFLPGSDGVIEEVGTVTFDEIEPFFLGDFML
jgi:hypothetical protein